MATQDGDFTAGDFRDLGVFEAQGLECVRGDRPIFAGLDLHLAPGEAVLLTGPNGSGKSSLLRLLAGLLAPAAGTLSWDGVAIDAGSETHRARLHYLGHLDAVKPVMSVAENLHFWAQLRGTGEAETRAALSRFALEHLADVAGRLLSAGQRRRLSLARIVATPAPLWLLDEPTVGLDAESVEILASLMAAHRAAGGRIAVATHQKLDLPGAAELSVDDYPPALPALEDAW